MFSKYRELSVDWGRVIHLRQKKKQVNIGSDNGGSPAWWQPITWNNTGLLLTGLWENMSQIQIFSFSKMRLQMMCA